VLAIVLFDTVYYVCDLTWVLVLSATFSHISAISWRPVLVVEEAGVPERTKLLLCGHASAFIDTFS
jgi:hypothetical protein